ncbi:MFS transporter [Oenococcus alcoholitolerans]|uniref:MFS transporter n=1 Tax=Oenococcus alcoholitolerans TaxID=931074 RepID=UPI003F6FA41C
MFQKIKKLPNWRKNIYLLWVGTFIIGVGSGEVLPFLSLFIETLGNYSRQAINFYAGAAFSSTFLMTAIVSPIWGKLADRVGRKPMLIRAALGMAIVYTLTGFSTQVWHIIALRALMGLFNGYLSNANALIAKDTPKVFSGQALGIVVTGYTSGALIGPLIGGFLANSFGYRIPFFITGVIYFLLTDITVFFVTEDKSSLVSKKDLVKQESAFKMVKYPKMIFGLFITSMIVNLVTNSINPILAQYVRQLMEPHLNNLSLIAGLVAAAPGITAVIFAPRFGRLGDKIGSDKLVIGGFIIGIAAMVPMSFVSNVWILFCLRLMIGLTNATMNPAIQAIMARQTPQEATGRIFSYNQSFMAMGNVFGPLVGSLVANIFDYRAVFIASALIMFFNLSSFFNFSRPLRR